MKNRKLSLLLAIPALALGLMACNGNNGDNTNTSIEPAETSSENTSSTNVEGNVTYRIYVSQTNGRPLSDFNVSLKKGSDVVATVATDSMGYADFNIAPDMYLVSVESKSGYNLATTGKQYTDATASELVTSIVYSTEVSKDPKPAGYKYEEGEPIHDFTLVDKDTKYTLSEILKEKDLVVLNFWYTTCTYCVQEFPLLESAYESYKDRVEVLAINSGADSYEEIKKFQSENGLTFPCLEDNSDLNSAFVSGGYPTSVFVDRYGCVAYIETGAILTESKWKGTLDEFLGDDYETPYGGTSGSDIVKPTIEFPGSEALLNAASNNLTNAEFTTATGKDAEYNWPWVPADDNMGIKPSNQQINSSYSILHLTVTVPANKVLAMDFKSSTESSDRLYIIKDNKKMFTISGLASDFETVNLFVAGDDEEVTFSFCYYKDNIAAQGDDCVYLRNFRFIDASEVTTPTYILRPCATGDLDPFTKHYANYVTAVYNTKDGYYHKDTEDGDLILADIIDGYTKFSDESIYSYAYGGYAFVGEVDYTDLIYAFANYASNSTVAYLGLPTNGLTPVTQELKAALDEMTAYLSDGGYYENQWLEVCYYISQYGTGGKDLIGDPIKGLASFSAYKATLGEENYVTFDRPIVPRGLLMEFVPETDGVYKIYSVNDKEDADCFIYDGNMTLIETLDSYNLRLREYFELRTNYKEGDDIPSFFTYQYLKAGNTYYICPAFWDLYTYDTIQVGIKYVGASLDLYKVCSTATFVAENPDMSGTIIAGKEVEVALGEDGYYHPVYKGVIVADEFIYADFAYLTGVFYTANLAAMIELGAFDFTVDEDGNKIEGTTLTDMTDVAKKYLALANDDKTSPEYGFVKVNAELADLLQKLMDKYTFEGVKDSWMKLCYYKAHLKAEE